MEKCKCGCQCENKCDDYTLDDIAKKFINSYDTYRHFAEILSNYVYERVSAKYQVYIVEKDIESLYMHFVDTSTHQNYSFRVSKSDFIYFEQTLNDEIIPALSMKSCTCHE